MTRILKINVILTPQGEESSECEILRSAQDDSQKVESCRTQVTNYFSLRKLGKLFCFILILFILFAHPSCFAASAGSNLFVSGFTRLLLAPLQLPLRLLQGTFQGPPGIGTVSGALSGTIGTITNLLGGAFDMVTASAPLVKYAVFFI